MIPSVGSIFVPLLQIQNTRVHLRQQVPRKTPSSVIANDRDEFWIKYCDSITSAKERERRREFTSIFSTKKKIILKGIRVEYVRCERIASVCIYGRERIRACRKRSCELRRNCSSRTKFPDETKPPRPSSQRPSHTSRAKCINLLLI